MTFHYCYKVVNDIPVSVYNLSYLGRQLASILLIHCTLQPIISIRRLSTFIIYMLSLLSFIEYPQQSDYMQSHYVNCKSCCHCFFPLPLYHNGDCRYHKLLTVHSSSTVVDYFSAGPIYYSSNWL